MPRRAGDIEPVSNPLPIRYLVRGPLVCAALLACGGNPKPETPAPLPPTAPIPTAGIAGQRVPVLPLTRVGAEEALGFAWVDTARHATLQKADSILGELLKARASEVTWVLPPDLRREARRSPTVATDPDQMGTGFLSTSNVTEVPDPLRSELRTLVALAGGRFVLAPAALVFKRTVSPPASGSKEPHGEVTAELTVVMIDSRLGQVGFHTVAHAEADDPWLAFIRAVKAMTPGLP